MRNHLYTEWGKEMQIRGRIYLSSEGINAQVTVPAALLETFKDNVSHDVKIFPFLSEDQKYSHF